MDEYVEEDTIRNEEHGADGANKQKIPVDIENHPSGSPMFGQFLRLLMEKVSRKAREWTSNFL